MAINVKSCYLFLLNNLDQSFVPTELPLDETVEGAYRFLEKNIGRCIKNAGGRPAAFKESSVIRKSFLEYRNRSIDFLEFAHRVATRRYDFKNRYELLSASDLFLCEVVIKDMEYVVGLELACKEGMVHHVNQSEGGLQNNLLLHQSIVPSASLSNANFFMIDLDKMTLTILENMVVTVDDDTYLYADKILECETKTSIKEAVKTARAVAEEIVEEQQLDHLAIIPALERTIKETVNEGEDIDFKEVAEEVFFQSPEAKAQFISEVASQGIVKPVENHNNVKLPLKKTLRLKTDIGIEITVPMDYYNNKDYIEVVNTPDGRLAIQIKNIGNIENK